AGRDRDADRRQRRRQVDAADDDLRDAAGAPRRHPLRGPRHHEYADLRDHAAGDRPITRGPADLPAHDRDGESADGRADGGSDEVRRRRREGLRPVPDPEAAATSARRNALGRRTADARDRPRTHEPAAAAAPGRAVARPGTTDRETDLPGHPRYQP